MSLNGPEFTSSMGNVKRDHGVVAGLKAHKIKNNAPNSIHTAGKEVPGLPKISMDQALSVFEPSSSPETVVKKHEKHEPGISE